MPNWRTFNLHIARVMEGTPESVRLRPRLRHNLEEIGFAIPPGGAATLEYLMSDYVVHLQHHLQQEN